MFSKFKNKTLLAVCDGESVPTAKIPDEVFAGDILGKGFAVDPSDGHIYSPADGVIEGVADSGHAYTLLSEDKLPILVHVGVDTVSLKGEGFTVHVKAGQRVKAGDCLCQVDLDKLRQKKLSAMTAVLVTEPERLDKAEYAFGPVKGGQDAVMTYRLKK